jgi:hypothetical protein
MISYKDFLLENDITVDGRKIKVVKADRAAKDKLVDVDVKLFDKVFSKSSYYIEPNGKNQIHGRYEKFGLFIKGGIDNTFGDNYRVQQATSMEASEVSVNKTGDVSFTNGRHRYAWLRDQGLDKVPVSMNKESVKNAKLFNYIR